MKFVDEAVICVQAGSGGDGHCSFRREKFIPRGGPDGGDGGDGGSVYLVVAPGLTTLVDFRHQRLYRAKDGEPGMSRACRGKNSADILIKVPQGTLVYDHDTGEEIGDLTQHGERLLVAQGGFHGLGNRRFRSSVDRAPRQTSKGTLGERRHLRLELQVLADVGLLGAPNAGKSSFIRAVSAATPKVADYPFTTTYPILGVVSVAVAKSFVVADIPGLISGAAKGLGLGSKFLRHLIRTNLLLHIVDASLGTQQVISNISSIEKELQQYDMTLYNKPRWLVLNKIDRLAPKLITTLQAELSAMINAKVYAVSAVTKVGCQQLVYAVHQWIEMQQDHG